MHALLDWRSDPAAPALRHRRDTIAPSPRPVPFGVTSESGVLAEVMLGSPARLDAVPCCAVTQAQLAKGFTPSRTAAVEQHRKFVRLLTDEGVRCRILPGKTDLPDMTFVRDAVSMTPWGLLRLAPATPHRRDESDHVLRLATLWGVPRIDIDLGNETVEGGDICLIRPGVVAIGWSGERTTRGGAERVVELYRAHGWRAILVQFDPHFLHLDTQFSMLDRKTALAAPDVLDPEFIDAITALGITIIPATYREVQSLGCNVVSLGRRRIVSAAHNVRINGVLESHGWRVLSTPLDQFTRCGGGPHCLTMPLARA